MGCGRVLCFPARALDVVSETPCAGAVLFSCWLQSSTFEAGITADVRFSWNKLADLLVKG
ncbi:hypothetical protein BJX61DRAFT_507723 [Aspergillus egyptiacus]|nr:hypothetical protein BJX61DRAFT_507723 [Aspergillus egyptiacus]